MATLSLLKFAQNITELSLSINGGRPVCLASILGFDSALITMFGSNWHNSGRLTQGKQGLSAKNLHRVITGN